MSQVRFNCQVNHRSLIGQVSIDNLTAQAVGEGLGNTDLHELSDLSQWLAEQRGLPWVAEFGREFWHERGGVLTSDDLLTIARTQVDRENQAVQHALAKGQAGIICDTTPLTTLIYHQLMFDAPPPAELVALAERPYHQLWLCAADFPMVQDGTRSPEAFRQQQQAHYHRELAERGLNHHHLTGSLPERQRLLLS